MSSNNADCQTEIKMLSDDMLLTHTSQEMFGRRTPAKAATDKERLNKRGVVNKKLALSKSLQGPPSTPKASVTHASGSGLRLASQLDRNKIQHNLHVGDDLKVVNSVKEFFEQRLQEMSHPRTTEQGETPQQRRQRVLLLTLQMPNYLRLLLKIARRRRTRIYSHAMRVWKTNTVALRALEKIIYGRTIDAARCLQRTWRRRHATMRLRRKQKQERRARQQEEARAAQRIAESLKQVAQRRAARQEVLALREERRERMAVRVQTVFRGWVARAWRTEQLRRLLLQDLRDWAAGNIQKLIDRPTQLDIYTEDMIRKAISLVANRPLHLRRGHPPKLLRIFRKQVRLAREREEVLNAQARAANVCMLRERALMAQNDKEDLFRRHFRGVLAQLARQAEAEREEQRRREEEDAYLRKARAEVFHLVERLKLEGILERSEREKMFREEYTGRRAELARSTRVAGWRNADLLLMGQEDHRASRLRAQESEKRGLRLSLEAQRARVKEVLRAEQEKQRQALQARLARGEVVQEAELSGLQEDAEAHLALVRLRGESSAQVAALAQQLLGRGQCPQPALCNCQHEWSNGLPLMQACAARVDVSVREAIALADAVATVVGSARRLDSSSIEKASVKQYLQLRKKTPPKPCQVNFKWRPDKNCTVKYRYLRALQALRLSREQQLRVLLESAGRFSQLHGELLQVRGRLRVQKFESRGERRAVLDQAVALEHRLEALEAAISESCFKICENGRLEKMNFLNLFCVQVGGRDRKDKEDKALLMKKKEKRVPGYMQHKKHVGPVVVAAANKHDSDRKKVVLNKDTGRLEEVLDPAGDSEADDEELACPMACTVSPKGPEQVAMPCSAPPLPPFVLRHLHQQRIIASQKRAQERRKREEQAAAAKQAALASPLGKFSTAAAEETTASAPASSRKSRVARLSMNVSSGFLLKDSEGAGQLGGGGGAGVHRRKLPRKSMSSSSDEDEGDFDFDAARQQSLFADVADDEQARAASRESSRVIPGLSMYPSAHTHQYLPLLRVAEVKLWSQHLSEWFAEVERQWKASKAELCLSFLQRARLLLTGGARHRQLLAEDVSLAVLLQRAPALDLVELLCCRRTLVMKVRREGVKQWLSVLFDFCCLIYAYVCSMSSISFA